MVGKRNLIFPVYSVESAARVMDMAAEDVYQLLFNGQIRACLSLDGLMCSDGWVFSNADHPIDDLPEAVRIELLSTYRNEQAEHDDEDFLNLLCGEGDSALELTYFDTDQSSYFVGLSNVLSTPQSRLSLTQFYLENDALLVSGYLFGVWQVKSLSMVKTLLKSKSESEGIQIVPVLDNAFYYSNALQSYSFIHDGFFLDVSLHEICILREDIERVLYALAHNGVVPPLNGERVELKASRVRSPSTQAFEVIKHLIEINPNLGAKALSHPTKAKELIDQESARRGYPPLNVAESTFASWLAQTKTQR